jgi:hypothetical protein
MLMVLVMFSMLDEDDKKLIGACGINCARCGIYQAYTEKDVERQRRIAEDIFGKDTEILPEQITCEGCGGKLDIHWSSGCEIMLCAHEKDMISCSQCNEFQCPKLGTFYSKGYWKANENALRQQKIGLEAWWKEQQ